MKTHGIVAADWQLHAAIEGRLAAIILPLQDVIAKSELGFHWLAGETYYFSPIMPDGSLDKILAVGDRIFLQEEWAKEDRLYVSNSEDPNNDYHWVGDAENMPPEAAQHWFEVTGVRVVQIKDLSPQVLFEAGLTGVIPANQHESADLVRQVGCAQLWDRHFAPLRWKPNRWVVVWDVKAIACYRTSGYIPYQSGEHDRG
jgi:hypothetical protein